MKHCFSSFVVHIITGTIFYLKVSRSRLPNKEFSIAQLAIAERNLDVFDCNNIDFDNRKRCF